MPRRYLLAGALAAASFLALAGCSGSHTASAAKSSTPTTAGGYPLISASGTTCGQGWTDPHTGQQTFVVKDTDINGGEVYLTDAKTGAVYAFLEPVSVNATANLDINLGPGTYAFKCAMEDEDTATGPTVTVTGKATGTVATAVAPVSQNDMIPPTKAYEAYVIGKLPGLAKQVATLRNDIQAGNLAKARTDWLPAHLEYERLGAAYDAFGDIDGAINGTTAGLPGGVSDPDFTGFHRIEYGLWNGQSAATLKPFANQLVADIGTLQRQFPTEQIDPLDLSIRAHEITENAVQFELTGQTNYGSNSNLATVSANLDGTVETTELLKSLLQTRYPGLQQLEDELKRAQADVNAQHVHGTWTPLAKLTTSQRERINSDMSELTELLAPIAAICEPRRTS